MRFKRAVVVGVVLVGGLYGCSRPDPLPVPEPARQMWPGAFFEVPQTIKGFGDVTPAVRLGGDEVMLRSRTAMLAYDAGTRRHRVLARAPEGALFGEVLKAVVGETEIVWLEGDQLPSTVWSMPRAGGNVRRVTTSLLESDPVMGMVVEGGKVVWWEPDGTTHELPLSGGRPRTRRQLDSSISQWPWGYQREGGVLNLITGEKRGTQTEGYDVRCGPEWCVSENEDSADVVVERLDGSDRRRVPGGIMREGLFAGERYGIFDAPEAARDRSTSDPGWTWGVWGDAVVIYDRCTGKAGLLDAPELPGPDEEDIRYRRSLRYPTLIHDGGDASGILMYWRGPGDRYTVFALPTVSAAEGRACI